MKAGFLWFGTMLGAAIVASLAAAHYVPHMVGFLDARHNIDFRVGLALPFHVVTGAQNGWPLVITVWSFAAVIGIAGWQMGRAFGKLGGAGLWLIVGCQLVLGVILSFYPATFSGDPYAYIIWGRVFGIHGFNPYLLFSHINAAGDPTLLRSLQFYGNPPPSDDHGPLWTLLIGGMTWLERSASLWSQVWTLRLVALGAAVATTLGLMRLLRNTQVETRVRRLAAFAFHPLVVYESAVGAHDDIAMVALAVWAFALVDEYPLIAGLLMGASASIKFVSLIAAPFLIIRAAKRGWSRGALSLTVMFVVSALCFKPFWSGAQTVYALLGHSGVLAMSPTWLLAYPFFREGLGNVPAFGLLPALPLLGQPSWPRLIQLALVSAVLVILVVSVWQYARDARKGLIWRSAAAFLWSSPIIHPWYLLWLVPAVADTSRWARYAWWFGCLIFLRYALDATVIAYALPLWELMVLTVLMMGLPVVFAYVGASQDKSRTAQRATMGVP